MTANECMMAAMDAAHIKTEEDCFDYGMVMFTYNESENQMYTKEAKKLFDEHYSRELKSYLNENGLTEEDINV